MAQPRIQPGIVAVLFATLALAACTNGGTTPTGTPSTPPATSAAAAAPAPYKASPLDLCNSLDLAPLAALSLKVEGRNSEPPVGNPGSACLVTLKTADGHLASLRVEAMVLSSVEEAKRTYVSEQSVTKLKLDREITGLGDQAEARSLESESSGLKQSEYMVHMRTGNMTVKTWVSVGGKAYVPKEVLAPAVEAVQRAVLAKVQQAWKQ